MCRAIERLAVDPSLRALHINSVGWGRKLPGSVQSVLLVNLNATALAHMGKAEAVAWEAKVRAYIAADQHLDESVVLVQLISGVAPSVALRGGAWTPWARKCAAMPAMTHTCA